MEPVNGASRTPDAVCFCSYRYSCLVDVLVKRLHDIDVKALPCSQIMTLLQSPGSCSKHGQLKGQS